MSKIYILLVMGLLLSFSACSKGREVKAPKENTIRMAIKAKIPSLDPHTTNDVYSLQVQGLVYESLYQYHYSKRPLEIIPLLAESLPTFSKDGKTMTIKIKKGVHYQDDPCFEGGKGREVLAEDFSYMIHRVSAPKFVSPTYSSFEDRVVGINDYHSGKAKTISGVKVLDPYTLQIQLMKSYPRYLYNFINAHSAPLPKECVEKLGDKFASHPVGTGPWKITEYDGNFKIVAVRNPNYHSMPFPGDANGQGADVGKPAPLADKIIYEIIIESQPQWLKFLAGELELTSIPKDNFAQALPSGKLASNLEKRGVQHIREVEGDVTCYIFNTLDPVWGKKKELRQAFALALDWNQIIASQYASQATRAHSLLDPTQYGYDPNWKSKWADRNIEKAKELLAKAGYPGGKGLPPIDMVTSQSTEGRQLVELLQRQVQQVGIEIKADVVTWPELTRKLRESKFTMVGLGYASDMPDADTAFPLIYSKNKAPGPNYSNYSNPLVDKLVDEVETMNNGPQRLAKIHQIRDILDEDLPLVMGVHRIGNKLVQPWVKNYVYTDDMYYGSFLKYFRVETQQ